MNNSTSQGSRHNQCFTKDVGTMQYFNIIIHKWFEHTIKKIYFANDFIMQQYCNRFGKTLFFLILTLTNASSIRLSSTHNSFKTQTFMLNTPKTIIVYWYKIHFQTIHPKKRILLQFL